MLAASAGATMLAMLAGCSDTSGQGDGGAPSSASYPIDPEEFGSGTPKYIVEKMEGWTRVTNEGGAVLGVADESKLIQVDGFAFKDLDGNGKLDLWEDWRRDYRDRAAALASTLDAETILPMMFVCNFSTENGGMSSGGGEFDEYQKGDIDSGFTQRQGGTFRADVRSWVKWMNEVQSYAEATNIGMPVQLYADPVNGLESIGDVYWPEGTAVSATFDPSYALEMGKHFGKAYRAMGIGTCLGPQMDVTTEPTWHRFSATFGDDPALNRDMGEAMTSGFQSTFDDDGTDLGWGSESINAMLKHWPGDGSAMYGRNSHMETARFDVYPNGNFQVQQIPFVDGGFSLKNSSTGSATAIMPSYSIAFSDSEVYGENVGSSYSSYILSLARSYGFDGLACSDWLIITDRPWGVSDLTPAQRVAKAFEAGLDMLGGETDFTPVPEGYEIMKNDLGEDEALERIRESARRILSNNFNIGLFDNPFLDYTTSIAAINDEHAAEVASELRQKAVVMLKNDGVVSQGGIQNKPKAYVPLQYDCGWSMRGYGDPSASLSVDLATLSKYFDVVTDTIGEATGEEGQSGEKKLLYGDIQRPSAEELADCEYALVFMRPPINNYGMTGYDPETQSFVPSSLQYRPFVADATSGCEEVSPAGGMIEVEVESVYGTVKEQQKENLSPYGGTSQVVNADQPHVLP